MSPDTPQEAEVTAGTKITPGRAYGFFTDTTLCIGCKACEVACKEWNLLPADRPGWTGRSSGHTQALAAKAWRNGGFVEQCNRGTDLHPTEDGTPERSPSTNGSAGQASYGPVPTLVPATSPYEAASDTPVPEGSATPESRWI